MSVSKPKPGAPGAIIGSPPTLEWIAVDRLLIDPTYQRAIDGSKSRAIIFDMVREWDWRLCQPLAVSRRADDALMVVDGQHRLEGAKRRGDIVHLPCVVTTAGDAGNEAALFVALNQRRQKLGQHDIFTAALAAGDEGAHHAFALIERAGLSLARHCNSTAWKPLQVNCGPAIQKALKRYGETVVSCALVALAEAYPDKQLVRAATILRALYPIYRDEPALDPDVLIAALGSVEQADWLVEAGLLRHGNAAMTTEAALGQAILAEYHALRSETLAA